MIHVASEIILRDTTIEERLPGVTYICFDTVHYLEFTSARVDELDEFLGGLESHVIVPDRLQSCLETFSGFIGFTNSHDAVRARMVFNVNEAVPFSGITMGFRQPC